MTDFTASAERQTERLTGILIDKAITQKELRLKEVCRKRTVNAEMNRRVRHINRMALRLLDGLICFKENILNHVLHCKMFTANYPLLIEHIIREAKLYREHVEMLENDGDLSYQYMRDTESFWNQ